MSIALNIGIYYFTGRNIWAISDIHVDFKKNADWIANLSKADYQQDTLILAGDVSHHFDLLRRTLLQLRKKFAHVFFVPGNHDLWIRDERWQNSIEKFNAIVDFCQQNQIDVHPTVFNLNGGKLCLVPIFSWYNLPHEKDSLYLPKPGEDPSNRIWSDNYFIHWPQTNGFKAADYFIALTDHFLTFDKCDMVISFSHFLPRQEVMFSGAMVYDARRMKKYDRFPQFNFSRVAGSVKIEKRIRRLGATIHIYGHQHINRDRVLDGVRYIAHCLGYPEERTRGTVKGLEQGLKRVY